MASTATKRRRAAKKSKQTQVSAPKRSAGKNRVGATRYDALNDRNLQDHWRWVDSRSVDASLDAGTRRRLRERARYEVANNSYAFGCGLAVANAVVGSGPRVQILSDLSRDETSRAEWAFSEWSDEINLAEKLRSMRFARFQDGESFGVLHTNLRLRTLVKLDLRPIDCERVSGVYDSTAPNDVDGIKLDKFGNPVSYRVLTRHPGDAIDLSDGAQFIEEAVEYPARSVVHWYRRNTAEQHRGVTELAASLNLFALLRRFTLAVVTAAETAADFAAIMYTDAPNDVQDATPFETFDIERGLMMTAPEGWKVGQLKSEQPTTTYSEFKRELLGEIGRSLQIPVNIIMGDSARYNYASGRLDHQEFQKAIRIDQAQCARSVMRPIFREWWREYALANELEPELVRKTPFAVFYWDGFEHVDPVKEANAQAIRLNALTTNLSIEYGKQGRDWEDELQQIARERQKMRELGLDVPSVARSIVDSPDADPASERDSVEDS